MVPGNLNDGLLAILSPQDVTEAATESIHTYAHFPHKPILASWMGALPSQKGFKPSLPFPW